MTGSEFVTCPVCSKQVSSAKINQHLDENCPDEPPKASGSGSITSMLMKAPPNSSPSDLKRKQADSASQTSSNKRTKLSKFAPLAERRRPTTLKDFVGHKDITGPDSLLAQLMSQGSVGSLILWGPPGCGKTTLARLLASEIDATFKELSATSSGINDVRKIFEEAKTALAHGRKTILFLDEIHRFTRAQQDIFLPYVEHGQIQLVGATTENPSFKLTGALLSRCRVFQLERLTDEDIATIIRQALEKEDSESSTATSVSKKIVNSIVSMSMGDARLCLSLVELALQARDMSEETLLQSLRKSVSVSYDRTGESHYDMISALHKSVRGSDRDAAMYWLARMISGGEDPLFIARRMIVCASEDIGLADNHALPLAVATMQACQFVGLPECRINLAHLVAYLAEAPKSTRSYEAYNLAEERAKADPTAPVPMAVRNAPTGLMGDLGYGQGYRYNPDYAHPVTNDYMPIKADFFKNRERIWDEGALAEWEKKNGPWTGRSGS